MDIIAELEKKVLVADAKVAAAREQKRVAARALEAAVAQSVARERLARMGVDERRALAQLISAEGIESGESVGSPGAD